MSDFKDEVKILRSLALRYREIANSKKIQDAIRLHKAVVDLHMIRPIVLMDELPWHELNIDGSLTLRCKDPDYCEAEQYFRRILFQFQHFPADMVLPPFYSLKKIIKNSGIGLKVEEETLKEDAANNISAHSYIDQLTCKEDLAKLHPPIITYLKEETNQKFLKLSEAFGDILPIKLVGETCFVTVWDDISRYRGVTPLLYDLYDDPELMHEIASTLFSYDESRLTQYEQLGLLELSAYSIHCTSALSDTLESAYDGGPILRKHVWGRGAAQIFSSVSPEMRDEFDIHYMKKIMEPFGMVYYGCCEPLDKMISIVEKIPNLRKITVTPWADVTNAAEQIKGKYVLSSKPNPAAVSQTLDEEALKKEIRTILAATEKNSCNTELVLKDISTCGYQIKNLIRWHQIVTEMVSS